MTHRTDEQKCAECEEYEQIREGSIHQIKAMNCRIKPSDPVIFDVTTDESVVGEAWQKTFLNAGTEMGLGDLSMMIGTVGNLLTSQSIKHKAEVEKARKEERERIYARLRDMRVVYETMDTGSALKVLLAEDVVRSNPPSQV